MRRKPHVVCARIAGRSIVPSRLSRPAFGWRSNVCSRGVADAIVSISPHEEEVLRRARFPLAKTKLIVSGMQDLVPRQTAQGEVRPSGPVPASSVCGRLDRRKGVDLLLREYELLKQKRKLELGRVKNREQLPTSSFHRRCMFQVGYPAKHYPPC